MVGTMWLPRIEIVKGRLGISAECTFSFCHWENQAFLSSTHHVLGH